MVVLLAHERLIKELEKQKTAITKVINNLKFERYEKECKSELEMHNLLFNKIAELKQNMHELEMKLVVEWKWDTHGT